MIYLFKIAAITRLLIGGARVLENRPHRLHDPEMSLADKKKTMCERIFIELFGTAGYLFMMHASQDVAAKCFEFKFEKDKLLQRVKQEVAQHFEKSGDILQQRYGGKTPQAAATEATKQFNQAFDRVFGMDENGLVDRVLNGRVVPESALSAPAQNAGMTMPQASTVEQNSLWKRMLQKFSQNGETVSATQRDMAKILKAPDFPMPGLKEYLPKEVLEKLTWRLSKASSFSILTGVISGALFGGFAIQWLNDRILAPFLEHVYGPAKSAGAQPQISPQQLADQYPASRFSQSPVRPNTTFPQRQAGQLASVRPPMMQGLRL